MLRKQIIKFVRLFLPKKRWRQYMTANFDYFDLNINSVQTKQYGKIYTPIYNGYAKIDGTEPKIYNADGSPVRTFFLRDKHIIWSSPQVSKYFMFERYNFELPVHFYTHNTMRHIMGQPQKCYGMFYESKEILPEDYLIFDRHPQLAQNFNAVFTYDEEMLNKLPNAREFCPCAQINFFGDTVDDITQYPNIVQLTEEL